MKFDEYVSAAMKRNDLKSGRQLSHALGLEGSAIWQMQNRGVHPSSATMMRLAQLAGVDPVLALMDLNDWREKDPEAKAAYRAIRKRLGEVAKMTGGGLGIVAVGAALTMAKPAPADAATAARSVSPVMYIMACWRRLCRWLAWRPFPVTV